MLNSESGETDKVDSSKQLYRRLLEVWEVTEGEIYVGPTLQPRQNSGHRQEAK